MQHEAPGGDEMAQDWPMFILQAIVVFGAVGMLFIRGDGDAPPDRRRSRD